MSKTVVVVLAFGLIAMWALVMLAVEDPKVRMWFDRIRQPRSALDETADAEHFTGYLRADTKLLLVEPDFGPSAYEVLQPERLDAEAEALPAADAWEATALSHLPAADQALIVDAHFDRLEEAGWQPGTGCCGMPDCNHKQESAEEYEGATDGWSPKHEVAANEVDYYEQSAEDQVKILHSEFSGLDAAMLTFGRNMDELIATICHHDPVQINSIYALREPTVALDVSGLWADDRELVAA